MIVYILSFVPYQFTSFGLSNGVCRNLCLITVYIEALVIQGRNHWVSFYYFLLFVTVLIVL